MTTELDRKGSRPNAKRAFTFVLFVLPAAR